MSQADVQYNKIIETILNEGTLDNDQNVRTKWADGTPAYTKSVLSQVMKFDNKEVPILTTKRVPWKTAIKELLWIWQMKSNDVRDLHKMNVHIWDEWMQDDFTIGKAYGYQLGKKNRNLFTSTDTDRHEFSDGSSLYNIKMDTIRVDQVDYLLHELRHNPSSRRHITTLWNPDDLDDMSLTPCVYETQWYVRKGKLSLDVRCRSNDMGLGNPFNIFQYNVLQRMFAQVLGYELGHYHFYIGDCHVYERHLEPLQKQISNEQYEAPTLWINPDVKSFYDFTIDDFKLIDYKHGETIKMEIAI